MPSDDIIDATVLGDEDIELLLRLDPEGQVQFRAENKSVEAAAFSVDRFVLLWGALSAFGSRQGLGEPRMITMQCESKTVLCLEDDDGSVVCMVVRPSVNMGLLLMKLRGARIQSRAA